MRIRKTQIEDIERVLQIYQYAREQMKVNGNPNQWGDNRPSRETIENDIIQRNSYVMEEDGKVHGVFVFIVGEEPTYQMIEQGGWLNDMPYGTIHRIASDGSVPGMLGECLNYCENIISNIRIDTHRDNKIMQHLIEKHGFQKCGIIYVEDKRLA